MKVNADPYLIDKIRGLKSSNKPIADAWLLKQCKKRHFFAEPAEWDYLFERALERGTEQQEVPWQRITSEFWVRLFWFVGLTVIYFLVMVPFLVGAMKDASGKNDIPSVYAMSIFSFVAWLAMGIPLFRTAVMGRAFIPDPDDEIAFKVNPYEELDSVMSRKPVVAEANADYETRRKAHIQTELRLLEDLTDLCDKYRKRGETGLLQEAERRIAASFKNLEQLGIKAQTIHQAQEAFEKEYPEPERKKERVRMTEEQVRDRILNETRVKAMDEAEKIELKIAIAVEAQKKMLAYLFDQEKQIAASFGEMTDEDKARMIAAIRAIAERTLKENIPHDETTVLGGAEPDTPPRS
jgi:hypothetical protein